MMPESIALTPIEIEFDEEVYRSIPAEAIAELLNGLGSDTPEAVLKEPEVTRMTREGHIMSDMTNWYSIAHRKWNSRSGNKITKITIHHMAGNLSKSQMESCVYNPNRQMSCNYAVYTDGSVECFVGEQFRSWCSSSWDNDKNAITIEVANNSLAPNWTVSEKAYKKLIALCADICKRNGIVPKYTGKTSGTLTVHRMFSNTSCPGPYLMKLHQNGQIEKDIKAAMAPPKPKTKTQYVVQAGAYAKKTSAVDMRVRITKTTNGRTGKKFEAFVKTENGMHKVRCGTFDEEKNAKQLLADLKKYVGLKDHEVVIIPKEVAA